MNQSDSKFCILAKNKAKALEAIKALAKKTDKQIKDSSGFYFSWVNTESFLKATTLEDAFYAWRWEVVASEEGHIHSIMFIGEKLGDDIVLFEAIAPFVKSGSYIDMQGEDGHNWRWSFKKGKCKELSGRVVYDED